MLVRKSTHVALQDKYSQARQEILDRMTDLVKANKEIDRLRAELARVRDINSREEEEIQRYRKYIQKVVDFLPNLAISKRTSKAHFVEYEALMQEARKLSVIPSSEMGVMSAEAKEDVS